MHDRHLNRKQYFDEQAITTERFVIPYIEKTMEVTAGSTVAEIGCGEGGNLLPFLERGCRIVGIDLATNKIDNAIRYFNAHPTRDQATFVAEDIYKVQPDQFPAFDLVIMKDTIEHIPDQEKFLNQLKSFLAPGAQVFFSFPPWRMPFGGHQQICLSPLLSKMPYFHLLPRPVYKALLSAAGENAAKINALMEIRDTRLSISRFESILQNSGYQINQITYYMINPNYMVKFNLEPKKLPAIMNVPHLKDFYTTAVYCVASVSEK